MNDPVYQAEHRALVKTRSARTAHLQELRQDNIRAARGTLAAYNEARGSMGSPPGMDYQNWTGGRGAQNSSNNCAVVTEFCVDVWLAIKFVMTKAELNSYLPIILNVERLVTTKIILDLENKLGAELKKRQIWPLHLYMSPRKVMLNPNRI